MNELAMITGGSKGIGKAFAESFLQHNIPVYLLARDIHDLENTRNEFQAKYSAGVHIASVDATKPGDVESHIAQAFETVDNLYFVNNAGVWIPYNKETHEQDLAKSLAINTTAPIRIAEYLLNNLPKEKQLHLITNLSHIVFRDFPGNQNYKPTKAALTEALFAFEERHKRDNIHFYNIYPASTASEFAVEQYRLGNFDAPTSLESLGDLVLDMVKTPGPTNNVYIGNFQKDIPELGLKKEEVQGISRIYLNKKFEPVHIQRMDPDFDVVKYFAATSGTSSSN